MTGQLLPRECFTDEEWELASTDRCCWLVTYGMGAFSKEHCGQPSDERSSSGYCTKHHDEARANFGLESS